MLTSMWITVIRRNHIGKATVKSLNRKSTVFPRMPQPKPAN